MSLKMIDRNNLPYELPQQLMQEFKRKDTVPGQEL